MRQNRVARLRALGWVAVMQLVMPAASAATLSPEQVVADWRGKSGHPLVGRILRTRDGRIVDGVALARGILTGNPIAEAIGLKGPVFVLLGEVHDNPEHHLLRAGLIDDMTERSAFGRNVFPAVVTEHIRAEQAPALEAFRALVTTASQPPTAADLFGLLEWDKSGWPSAAMFRPLYDVIIGASLPIAAGDVSRARIRAIARGGATMLAADERDRLRLDAPFPQPLRDALAAELEGSHCGMLPSSAIGGMALAQRYRDAHLAQALAGAVTGDGRAILLAGNGHVRSDRGVPWYLRLMAPGKSVLAVMLTEVADGTIDPQAYVAHDPEGKPAADVIVFTPRAAREDPCERMRATMQNKG